MPDIVSINSQNAGYFSELACQGIGTGIAVTNPGMATATFDGWTEITEIADANGTSTALQKIFTGAGIKPNPSTNNLENQFRIFSNGSQIVFAFKGSDAATNWADDLLGQDGANAYSALKAAFKTAYNYVHNKYPNAQIVTDGHSLGAGSLRPSHWIMV